MNLDTASLRQLRTALDTGETTAVGLAGAFLDRIAASELNAFIYVRPYLTLALARLADARRARG